MARFVVNLIRVIKYIDSSNFRASQVLSVTCVAVFEGTDFLVVLRNSEVQRKLLNLRFSSKISSGVLSLLAFSITFLGNLHVCMYVCIAEHLYGTICNYW
jgi:hypothetical protein